MALSRLCCPLLRQQQTYDKFLKEQIAGDELYPGNTEALIATGFHRAGPIHNCRSATPTPNESAGSIDRDDPRRGEHVFGLTIGCARCHNHKFDPLLQADYYRLQAVFAATDYKDIELEPKEKVTKYEADFKAGRLGQRRSQNRLPP